MLSADARDTSASLRPLSATWRFDSAVLRPSSAITRSFSAWMRMFSAVCTDWFRRIPSSVTAFARSACVLALAAAVVACSVAASALRTASPTVESTSVSFSSILAMAFSASLIRPPSATSGARMMIAVFISTLSSPSCGVKAASPEALLSTMLNCSYSLLRQSLPKNLPFTSKA